MNLTILTNTRIGKTVNSLRLSSLLFRFKVLACDNYSISTRLYRKSSDNDDVIATAKSLIKIWKKFVPERGDSKSKEKSKDSFENGNRSDDKISK